jgi:hypothetical protein
VLIVECSSAIVNLSTASTIKNLSEALIFASFDQAKEVKKKASRIFNYFFQRMAFKQSILDCLQKVSSLTAVGRQVVGITGHFHILIKIIFYLTHILMMDTLTVYGVSALFGS